MITDDGMLSQIIVSTLWGLTYLVILTVSIYLLTKTKRVVVPILFIGYAFTAIGSIFLTPILMSMIYDNNSNSKVDIVILINGICGYLPMLCFVVGFVLLVMDYVKLLSKKV